MQNGTEDKSNIPARSNDDVLPPLAVRLTMKVMRLIFIGKMFEYSFVPFLPFSLLTFDSNVGWFIAYSAIVSIWGFAVWMERAYRNKINLQPPRCTKIICSRCNTRIKSPKWFKYKNWLYFFLLYVSLTTSNLIIQLASFITEMSRQGISVPGMKKPDNTDYSVLIMSMRIIGALIHYMTAHLFKEYYLHNGPLEKNDRTSTDEKTSENETL
ncbi:HN1_G0024860.mRNA.1.CDS.1 [Saccharomyces cerevisiae]|nr:HN1_G0024860.mRNA.1.CDS.1 [Saccharomyces cerevisiae]CAI4818253.1 BAL_1a_G0055590.mRNA.1.CDS.1 [Saccharomyces cerevisiae]CAI7387496.1 BAL_1a_G0055590.mRNA.1.CDS.1 [Saccharomyces cerevisiae]